MTSRVALGSVLALVGIGAAFAACSSSRSAPVIGGGLCPNGSGVSRGRLQVPGLLPAACTGDTPESRAAFAENVARASLEAPRKAQPDLTTFGWIWNTPTPTAPVTGSPAIINPSYPSQSPSEILYVGTSTSSGTNFYALGSLTTSTPTTLWSFAATGSFDGSWVALDALNQVYALDTSGKLYCFLPNTGALCAGWASQSFSAGATTSRTSPWWDSDSNAVFIADGAGILHKIAAAGASAGTQLWQLNLNSFNPSACPGGCSTFGVRSTPIVYNHQIYVGNDGGAFFRITDPNSGTTAPTAVAREWLCGSPTSTAGCGAAWSVLNASTLDVAQGLFYAAANGTLFEYAISGAFVPHQASVSLGASGYNMYSSPIVDTTNHFLYAGYDNRIHKVAYPLGGSPVDRSTALAGAGADPSYPRATPLTYNGQVTIGNGAGFYERYGCVGSTSGNFAPELTAQTSSIGTSIDSDAIVDFKGGNVSFGFTNGTTNGGVVQLSQTGAWGCGATGTGSTCVQSCGDTGTTTICGTCTTTVTMTFRYPNVAGITSVTGSLSGSATLPFSVSTAGATCAAGTSANTSLPGTPSICRVSTIIGLPLGAWAISANTVSAGGLNQASNANPNKILLTGTGDQTSPIVNLVRVFPVTTNGTDATCPLNLAIDSSDNVWTVNANPYLESTCASPTGNLSELVAGSAYAPTVYGSATTGITGTPEFIAADNAGDVWVTAPTMGSGIFHLSSSGAPVAGFSAGNCQTPRGIDNDPTQSPNGAFVACYGTNAAPPAGGSRKILQLTSAGAVNNSVTLTDLADQPIAVTFAHAVSENSTTIYTTDYRCDTDVYVNRVGAAEVTVSRVDGALNNLSSFTASTSSDNPYGLASDGCGTVFNAERATGDIRDFEMNAGSPPSVVQDSDNFNGAVPSPFGVAVDDNYSFNFVPYGYCNTMGPVSPGNLYAAHSSTNRVTRYNNTPQTAMNDFIVGSTASPAPRGAVYDRTTQFIWVANSAEGTLSRVHRDLFLFANDALDSTPSPASGSACTATVTSGASITLTGNGFDTTTIANNTVLVSGYLATVTAASASTGNASQPNSLTVTVPNAVSATTGPIIVSNQSGNVVSLCTYTTH
jgi:hypothetical protein